MIQQDLDVSAVSAVSRYTEVTDMYGQVIHQFCCIVAVSNALMYRTVSYGVAASRPTGKVSFACVSVSLDSLTCPMVKGSGMEALLEPLDYSRAAPVWPFIGICCIVCCINLAAVSARYSGNSAVSCCIMLYHLPMPVSKLCVS